MKNITLAIEESVLDEVRVIAAKRGTSVNGLVREFLQQISDDGKRVRRALLELRAMSETSPARLGPDYKFDREATYER